MNCRRLIIPLAAFIAVCALGLFILGPAKGAGSEAGSAGEASPAVEDGALAAKEEVVYATLSPEGKLKGVYIVNMLDVSAPGKIVDYGQYASASILTGLSDISLNGNRALIDAPAGKLYYQGNMNEADLPWLIDVSYYLNGQRVPPDELAGGSGELALNITIKHNERADPQYYQNYLLQVSLTLDADKCGNIAAKDGAVSSAGALRMVTFTVMPEHDADLTVTADVTDFSMAGIDFAAVPYGGMGIEMPDTTELTDPLVELTGAIELINGGALSLKDGISAAAGGAQGLQKGSAQYQAGLNSLNESASGLLSASEKINDALGAFSENLSTGDFDLSGLVRLPHALNQFAQAMREASDGLKRLADAHASILAGLDSAMDKIPAHMITQEEIDALYESVPERETLDKLVETYRASITAKNAYASIKEQFAAVNAGIEELSAQTSMMALSLETAAQELSAGLEQIDPSALNELAYALKTLHEKYALFHGGLAEFTGGVSELLGAYKEINSGIGSLSGGTDSLNQGAGELFEGTDKLYDNTRDMPGKIEEEIDKLMPDYGGEGFKPISFASPENGFIDAVQFVIKTEPVERENIETGKQEQPDGPISFWQRLLALFGL